PRRRVGGRDLVVLAGRARDVVQPAAFSTGEPMSTDTAAAPAAIDKRSDYSGAPRRSIASRLVSKVAGGVVQVVLILVAAIWLVPTLGLFVASLRSQQDDNSSGWWHV